MVLTGGAVTLAGMVLATFAALSIVHRRRQRASDPVARFEHARAVLRGFAVEGCAYATPADGPAADDIAHRRSRGPTSSAAP